MTSRLLSLLSVQDQKGFLWVDLLNNAIFCGVWYYYVWKDLTPFVAQEKEETFLTLRDILLKLLLIQFLFQLFSVLFLSFGIMPCILHEKMPIRGFHLFSILFSISWILRLIVLILSVAFLVPFISSEEKNIRNALWGILLLLCLGINLYGIFYSGNHSLNPSLSLYEAFYKIRNVYIRKDPKKQNKIKCILNDMKDSFGGNVPPQLKSVYEKQWKCTFKNPVQFF